MSAVITGCSVVADFPFFFFIFLLPRLIDTAAGLADSRGTSPLRIYGALNVYGETDVLCRPTRKNWSCIFSSSQLFRLSRHVAKLSGRGGKAFKGVAVRCNN